MDYFTDTLRKAFRDFINDKINERLQSAIDKSDDSDQDASEDKPNNSKEEEVSSENGIVTTEEELRGYEIIRELLTDTVDPERITHKDTKAYFNVLLDNNTWRQICRLYFNYKSIKRIGLFDKDQERKVEINSVDDIKNYKKELREALLKHLK